MLTCDGAFISGKGKGTNSAVPLTDTGPFGILFEIIAI